MCFAPLLKFVGNSCPHVGSNGFYTFDDIKEAGYICFVIIRGSKSSFADFIGRGVSIPDLFGSFGDIGGWTGRHTEIW